jgi:hypothetical protein
MQKSFAPLLWKFSRPSEIIESGFITNAVPGTAENPPP